MRLTKMLGLAMVAAIAAMAFVGAGVASANLNTALCKKAELVCADQYPSETQLKSSLKAETEAVLTGTLAVKCKTSTIEGQTTTGLGTTVLGFEYANTFTNCNTCKEIVSLVSKAAPRVGHLKNAGNLKASFETLKPVVDLIDCTFLNIDCTASAESVTLDVDTSGATPTVKAINEPLNMAGGFGCGEKGTWNAEYVLTAPSPVFIEG